MEQKNTGVENAFKKIKHYCAYRERNHFEVKGKLYSLGLFKKEVELITSRLIEENFLNEERYAIAFAVGKFRLNKWGRIKIKYELQKTKVSAFCIGLALAAIDENEYQKIIKRLLDSKSKTLTGEKNILIKQRKLLSYLLQKGFEPSLVTSILKTR